MIKQTIITNPPHACNGRAQHPASRRLDETIQTIRRRFGTGAIFRLGDASHLVCRALPTGIPPLDVALGIGGLPVGRVVDIYGPEQSGKTTLCLMAIAQAQQRGGIAVYINPGDEFDRDWAARWGVDTGALYLAQPDCGEQALEIADTMARARADVIVVDSAAALTPQAEMRGEMGDNHLNYGALMSQALRKLAGAVRKNNTLLIFTNQMRVNGGFIATTTTTGGRALRYYAAIRLDLRRLSSIKSGDQIVGSRHRAVVKKNKVAPPFRECEFDILAEVAR